MNVGIRIISLSLIMSIYMVWAFRGVESDPQEAISALLMFLGGFLVLTVVAVPIYKMTGSKVGGTLAEFTFRCWLVTATLVTIGWLVFFAQFAQIHDALLLIQIETLLLYVEYSISLGAI